MQFKDIIGQEGIKQKLASLVSEDRLPHALMLVGPAGTGKRSLALATAQFLACQDRQAADSCGRPALICACRAGFCPCAAVRT